MPHQGGACGPAPLGIEPAAKGLSEGKHEEEQWEVVPKQSPCTICGAGLVETPFFAKVNCDIPPRKVRLWNLGKA